MSSELFYVSLYTYILCSVVLIITHLIEIQGKPLIVKCGVNDFVSGGNFTWRIGKEIIPRFVFVIFLYNYS